MHIVNSKLEPGFHHADLRPDILESWDRCKGYNLNSNIDRIAEPEKIGSYYHPNRICLKIITDFTLHFYENIEQNSEAQFYAYDNGSIFAQFGSEDVLTYFNSVNIGIGTCIFEEYLGTTAVSFVDNVNEEAWVQGREHYLDILTPFATYCFYLEELRMYCLIILPIKKFTSAFLNGSNVFYKTLKATIRSYRKDLELSVKTEVFDELLETRNRAILFVDNLGMIITATRNFCDLFGLLLDDIKDLEVAKVFPDLNITSTYLHIGERKLFEKIKIKNAPMGNQYFRIEIVPVSNRGEISGVYIVFSDPAFYFQKRNQVRNSNTLYTFDRILGNTLAMKKVKKQAIIAAHSNSTIVITGESGTGKEIFAQSIHNESLRRDKPFVAVNCAGLPEELITSELFGYIEGAFTGAKKGGSIGKFEYANEGTIFLDEIGELPLSAQAILLRVLEERMVTKIGSNTSVPINIRLICATNRDLKKMVNEGRFRLDLYYRINVIHLHLPPLRDQITDVPVFANFYIQYFNDTLGKQVEEISQEALAALIRYDWPGNLREFRNIIECAMNNVDGHILNINDLPDDIWNSAKDITTDGTEKVFMQNKDFYSEERKRILGLMIEYSGNKSQVAEELGISRSTLYKKIKGYKLI